MRFRRPRARIAGLFALAGMLFLQAAIAFAACELDGRSAAVVLVTHTAMPDCHDTEAEATLCLAHCQSEEQTVVKVQASLPDLPAPPGFVLRVAQAAVRVAVQVPEPYAGTVGPPPRIRFQSFLL